MRGKCKGAKAEIDVRLLETATVSVEARPYRKVADIRIETVNAQVTWEADLETLGKLREMFNAAEKVLAATGKGDNAVEGET